MFGHAARSERTSALGRQRRRIVAPPPRPPTSRSHGGVVTLLVAVPVNVSLALRQGC